jgi:hypothetical protein
MEATMAEQIEQDVRERIMLIENMMLEGRKTTEYWGWSFALWGIAYLTAIGWSYKAGTGAVAWPVTMIAAGLITSAVVGIRSKRQPQTTRSRAIGAVWSATGAALFAYCFAASISGHAVANLMSGILLRWRMQQVVGGIWWTAGVYSFFLAPRHIMLLFIAVTLVCQVGFGIYLMVREARDKARARAGQVSHA